MNKEASIFSQYLIGEEPNEQTVKLYSEAHNKIGLTVAAKDEPVLKYALQHPNKIAMFDSALSLSNPTHALRKKIYLMFCILESSTAYCHYFLPQKRKWSYLFFIVFVGIRALTDICIGYLLLLIINYFPGSTKN